MQINLPVLAFAMGLSLLTALLFGLAPVRQALHASLVESLKEGGRSRTGGREGARWRNALIVVEVGLSIVLLTGAGLMIQTFWRLSHLNLGFEASRVLNVRNSLRGATYATPEARRNHFAAAAAKLAAIPGVESVSAVSFPPPSIRSPPRTSRWRARRPIPAATTRPIRSWYSPDISRPSAIRF